jgi:hypothetical protein
MSRPLVHLERTMRRLLRSHEAGFADHLPDVERQCGPGEPDRRIGGFGKAEVDDLCDGDDRSPLAPVHDEVGAVPWGEFQIVFDDLGYQDVVGAEISVNETLQVRVLDSLTNPCHQLKPSLNGKLSVIAVLVERQTVDVLHCDERGAVDRARFIYTGNTLVLQER